MSGLFGRVYKARAGRQVLSGVCGISAGGESMV
nr:MAG TPA: hypothetical protein [Caudoviricetes sp.]